MSLKAMTWVWTLDLPRTPKLVLMALADQADEDGFCFPSHRHLAAKCNMSERTVRRTLEQLAGTRHLGIEPRFRRDRSQSSNGYSLALEHSARACPPGMVSDGQAGWPAMTRGPGHAWPGALVNGVQVTTTESVNEPKPQPPRERVLEIDHDGGGGDLFFPKALTKDQVTALDKLLAGIERGQAQQVLDELAGRMARIHVKNPIRYLAVLVSRLNTGEFSSELGVEVAAARAADQHRRARLQDRAKAPPDAGHEGRKPLPEPLRLMLDRIHPKLRNQASGQRNLAPPSPPSDVHDTS